LALNTRKRPFSNVNARRALSYAVDRRRVVGNPADGEPACQLLPPGFPGYAPDCRFTTNPDGSGGWHGPDVRRARRLIRRSGTATDPVVLWFPKVDRNGRYFKGLLHRIGFQHVRLRSVSIGAFFDGVDDPDPAARHDITPSGWIADFPAAWDFYHPILSCDADPGGNVGRHCDRALDRTAQAALAVQDTDPGRADELWRQVFRTVDDTAVVVPLVHWNMSVVVSARTGNYHANPQIGPLYDQMWVK
jgi:peptide/nickel transport system substrate-binding protein